MDRIKNIKPEGLGGVTINESASDDAKKAFGIALKIIPEGCVYREGVFIFRSVLGQITKRMTEFKDVEIKDICRDCMFAKDCPYKPEMEDGNENCKDA